MSYDFVSCLPPVSLCWCVCVCVCARAHVHNSTASLHGLCHSVFFSCATVHVCFPVLRRQYPCCIIITVYTIMALSYEEVTKVTTQVIMNNAGPYITIVQCMIIRLRYRVCRLVIYSASCNARLIL